MRASRPLVSFACSAAIVAVTFGGCSSPAPIDPGTGGSLGNGGSAGSGGAAGKGGSGAGGATGGSSTSGVGGSGSGGNGGGGSGVGGGAGGKGSGGSGTGGTTEATIYRDAGPDVSTGREVGADLGTADGRGAGQGGNNTGGSSSTGGKATGGSTAVGGVAGGGTTGSTSGAGGSTGTVSTLPKFVGNITTNNQVDTGGLTYATYWDQISPENAGKWGSVQSSGGGSYNWGTLDAIYDYTEKHKIIFKEHCFVWGSQQPGGTITQANVQAWMQAFCKRYPNTKLIDVVNEPPPHTTPSYASAIGGGTDGDWKWITNAFTWAREACPNATLILNDYNDIEWSGDIQHMIDIVTKIKAAGAPIDAIGAQSHDAYRFSAATLKANMDKVQKATGLPMYITEYDISNTDDAAQLKIYQDHIPMFLSTDYVKGITIWGWIYGSTWQQAANSGLIRNGKARSAMTWLMQTLGRPAPP
jgi:endo-1,4-beta-xylanase